MTNVVAMLTVLAGCLPPGPSTYEHAPQASTPAGATCVQVVQCLAQCTQSECMQSCMTSGDRSARAAVEALIACNAAGGTCEAELQACQSNSVVAQNTAPVYAEPAVDEQMLPGQPHTTANLLPWLVGNWEGNNYHYTFYPDGRVKRASGVARYAVKDGRYACSTIMNEIGTVRQEGDVLIMEFAAAEENHCGDKSSAPSQTVRNRIVWYQYNGPVELKLVDIDCDRGLMYCSDPIHRR